MVPEAGVQTTSIIVDLDVLKHHGLGYLASAKALPMNGLNLDAVTPALDRRIVVTVTTLAILDTAGVSADTAGVSPRFVACNNASTDPIAPKEGRP